jgi:hypothetical protein
MNWNWSRKGSRKNGHDSRLTIDPAWSRNGLPDVFIILRYGRLTLLDHEPNSRPGKGAHMSDSTTSTTRPCCRSRAACALLFFVFFSDLAFGVVVVVAVSPSSAATGPVSFCTTLPPSRSSPASTSPSPTPSPLTLSTNPSPSPSIPPSFFHSLTKSLTNSCTLSLRKSPCSALTPLGGSAGITSIPTTLPLSPTRFFAT